MKFQIIFHSLLLAAINLANAQIVSDLIIRPERSKYTETSTYEDVMNFVSYVHKYSDLVHLEIMLTSTEGRDIPLIVLANPKVSNPGEARLSGKPVIYIQGNIHGGEVEGKEAVMIMIREILFGDKRHLLDNQIILFAPIFNADGNEKMLAENRRSQEGSPELAGGRRSGGDYDLNRDGIKMEAIETKGLISNVLLRWDPQLLVDLHTTNGTWHGNALTYAPSYHYAGHPSTSEYIMDVMLPALQKAVLEKYDLHFDIYGGYNLRQGWPPKNLYTYNHHPRYIVNQMGLRNRMGILSETFAHDRFDLRINSAHIFVNEILEFTNIHGLEIIEINDMAEHSTRENIKQNAGDFKNGVRFKMVPTGKPLRLRTYEYLPYSDDDGNVNYARSGNIIYVDSVNNYNAFEATLESTVPAGYVFSADLDHIANILSSHGVEVKQLQDASTFSGEKFVVEKLELFERRFEGHNMATLSGSFSPDSSEFKKGDFMVDMNQPLSNLIFYMLEPQSDDGLAAWNFFDKYLINAGVEKKPVAFPVFKFW